MSRFFHSKKFYLSIAILFFLGLILALSGADYLFVNPFGGLEFEGVVYAAKDEAGNLIVLDKAGERLLKIDPENRLLWKKEASSGIFEAAQRAVPYQGHIYLHDVMSDEGIRLSGERILELDGNGRYVGKPATYLYSERIVWPNIIGLFPAEDGLAYVYRVDGGIRFVRLGEREESLSLPGAGRLARSAAFDPDTGAIFYSTYDGRILQYVDGNADRLLYHCRQARGHSIPAELSFHDGVLYATDLGTRCILTIRPEDGTVEPIEEDINYFSREIAYDLNAQNGLVAVSDYSARIRTEGNAFDYLYSCSFSPLQCILSVGAKAGVLVDALIVAAVLLIFVLRTLQKGTFYARMILGVVTGSILLSLLIIAVMIPRFQESLLNAFFERAQLASAVVTAQLPADAFTRLDSADDFMGEDYEAVREMVTSIFFNETETMRDLYCVLYKVVDNTLVISYSLTEGAGAIYPYDWPMEGSLEEEILTTGKGVKFQSSTSEGEYLFTYDPLFDDQGNAIGIIEVGKDMKSYRKEINSMIFDAFVNVMATTVVMILTVFELIHFFKGRSEYIELEKSLGKGRVREIPAEIMRMVSFLVFFLTNLATAFLPVYAMQLSEEVSIGLAPEVMAAIPISAEVITGAIFSVVGVNLVEKMGEKKAVFFSSILFIAGFVLRIIPHIGMLILGNAVLGVGWGVILLVATMRISDLPEEKKDNGFSQYNVAALNGVNCGVVFGGFLVNWMDYRAVFIISAILSVSMLLVAGRYFNAQKQEKSAQAEEKKNGFFRTIAFVLNPQVLSLMLMIVAPIMICYYFLNYLYPIIGTDYGLSETYIGYSYLLNGLCVMLFGGVLTDFFTRKRRKKEGILLASLLYALAFFLVVRFKNLPALFAALSLLGVSDSFGLPLQTGYYTDLRVVQRYGYGQALGIYNLVVNVAQSIGPFVFSYVLIAGMNRGLMIVLITVSILAVLFFLIGKWTERRANALPGDSPEKNA